MPGPVRVNGDAISADPVAIVRIRLQCRYKMTTRSDCFTIVVGGFLSTSGDDAAVPLTCHRPRFSSPDVRSA